MTHCTWHMCHMQWAICNRSEWCIFQPGIQWHFKPVAMFPLTIDTCVSWYLGKWFSHWYTWDMFGMSLGYFGISLGYLTVVGFLWNGASVYQGSGASHAKLSQKYHTKKKRKIAQCITPVQCSATCTKVTLFPIIALYNGNGWEKKCGHLFMVLI